MSLILLKIILACFLLAAAIVAVLSMFSVMGKAEEKKANIQTLRKIHRFSGWLFLLLLLPLLYLGFKFWVNTGDQASLRAVFHAVLALGLFIVILLKTAIVKFYKKFLRLAPGLGMMVFGLAFVVFSISAGFYALRAWVAKPTSPQETPAVSSGIVGDAARGASLYKTNCLSCHYADSEDEKMGPGLKNLFKKETLPYSDKPATVENVKQQLLKPVFVMPSFTQFSQQEMADLTAYLKTL
jgi:mono/diheme cytochrome c family protein